MQPIATLLPNIPYNSNVSSLIICRFLTKLVLMENLKNTLLLLSQYGMGTGDEALGLQLVTNYLNLMNEEAEPPRFVALYNGGVKLICEGSPVIDIMKELEQKGVKLLACKTCLRHFDLLNKMEAGIAGTMMDIVQLQKAADKVITL